MIGILKALETPDEEPSEISSRVIASLRATKEWVRGRDGEWER